MSEYDFVSSRTPIAVREWPLWTVTTDTGWQRESPRGRPQVRMCRRLRNWKPKRRWNGQTFNLCSYDEVEEFLHTIGKVT